RTSFSASVATAPQRIIFSTSRVQPWRDNRCETIRSASWQMTHLSRASSAPLPSGRSCRAALVFALIKPQAAAVSANDNLIRLDLRFDIDPHLVDHVPEIARRVPPWGYRLNIAFVVSGARHQQVRTGAGDVEFVFERLPGVTLALLTEFRREPGASVVHRDVHFVDVR